jgi:fused signal recognition particle receptor
VIIAIVLIALVVVAVGTMLAVRTTTLRRSRRRTEPDAIVARPAPSPAAAAPSAAPIDTGVATELPAPPPAGVPVEDPAAALVVGAAPRLGDRLGRARQALAASFAAVRGRGRVDAELFDELEEALILADVGLPTTNSLLDPLRATFRSASSDPDAVLLSLKGLILGLFEGDDATLTIGPEHPSVWLFVGVNGVGKTTTIGKLAYREKSAGHSVVLAAGDTFRAAAGEQLDVWAKRTDSEIVQGADGADPSSVIFDGIAHAGAISADLVLADTAGRLHTKSNLMEELRKVRRVADRPPGHVTEVLLVIDATTGQNGLTQAREFSEAVGVTGIVLTKLDGSAKGGIVLAIRSELGLPIKLVGLGEGVADLVEFDPEEFVDALFA